ncbi:hypothetical protein [Salibacterium halotolerans]|uniref:Uncharacterized protein n=1 Tax=Salibacterium halotolerans TaxID=1884432 RepID=A0A1I5RM85_9BACI|nr:hypothetical protein [Salibacterium halotolerans]SFP59664.1 hypothetical protein SAMN05518683_10798 [Salibacterium halotolerans]
MPDKKYAYLYDGRERRITVGTSETIEGLKAENVNIYYAGTEEELAADVHPYYKREYIVTMANRLHDFEDKLFL